MDSTPTVTIKPSNITRRCHIRRASKCTRENIRWELVRGSISDATAYSVSTDHWREDEIWTVDSFRKSACKVGKRRGYGSDLMKYHYLMNTAVGVNSKHAFLLNEHRFPKRYEVTPSWSHLRRAYNNESELDHDSDSSDCPGAHWSHKHIRYCLLKR